MFGIDKQCIPRPTRLIGSQSLVLVVIHRVSTMFMLTILCLSLQLYKPNAYSDLNRWLSLGMGSKTDQFLEDSMVDDLFLDPQGMAFDLASLNIQVYVLYASISRENKPIDKTKIKKNIVTNYMYRKVAEISANCFHFTTHQSHIN